MRKENIQETFSLEGGAYYALRERAQNYVNGEFSKVKQKVWESLPDATKKDILLSTTLKKLQQTK